MSGMHISSITSGSNHRVDYAEVSDRIPKEETEHSIDVQNVLQEYIEDNGAVGASVAIVDNGRVTFYTYGKKSVNTDDLISEETVFEIGSITKVFTSLLLADMAAKGEMQLDDPIEMHLPGVKIPELDGKKITLRHLATHTSGLPRLPENFTPEDPSNPYKDYTIDRLYEALESCTLTKPPGDSFEYSNLAVGLLGHILSVRSGKSYEEMVQEVICSKLNMPKTSITLSDEMASNLATGYHLSQPVNDWDLPTLAGAGALRSNVKDMANFLIANMDAEKASIHTLLKQCHQQQSSHPPLFKVGLGWMLSTSNQAKIVWHNGGTGGFRSYIGFNPNLKKGIVILSNSTDAWPDTFGPLILDPDYKPPSINPSLANDPDYLNTFAGSYTATLTRGSPEVKEEWNISVSGKCLTFVVLKKEEVKLYPESHGVFRVRGGPDVKVSFSFNESGCIEKVEGSLISNGTLLWEAVPKVSDPF